MRPVVRCGIWILTASLALAGNRLKIAEDLQKTDRGATVDIIVQFKHAPSEARHQRMRARGGVRKADLELLNGASYSIPASALDDLSADPEILYISLDHPVNASADYDYGPQSVDAPLAWNSGLDGSGIGIAVIDSGIYGHKDLRGNSDSRVVYREDFVSSGGGDNRESDDEDGGGAAGDRYGHGTHVAGIIAGNGNMSNGHGAISIRGVAPNAQLINLRVLDANGNGRDSDVIRAIYRAIQLKSQYKIRVINLSLGRPVFESYKLDPLCQAVEQAWNAGIVVVVSGGNGGRDNSHGTNGYGTITAPCNDPYVITVGAMRTMNTPSRTDDLIASYSSKGPTLSDHFVKPDI